MRKDTLTLIPELDNKKETLGSLIDLATTKKQIEAIQGQKERAEKMMGGFTDEYGSLINKLLEKGMTVQKIKGLKDEDINNLFIREDGTEIPINVPVERQDRLMAFKRDFLEMLLNNKVYFDKIDEQVKEMDKMIAEYNEEVRNLFAETNGDAVSLVRKTLEEQKATATGEHLKAINQVLETIDDGLDLNRLYDTYKDLDPRNTINDFLRRGVEYSEQYQRNCKNNGVAADYSRFDLLEVQFLEEEKYHKYRNFFIFLVVKMYARKKNFTRLDSIFLTQLVANLQILLYDHKRGSNLSDEQLVNRERLIAGIKRVLDLFFEDEDLEVVVDEASMTGEIVLTSGDERFEG